MKCSRRADPFNDAAGPACPIFSMISETGSFTRYAHVTTDHDRANQAKALHSNLKSIQTPPIWTSSSLDTSICRALLRDVEIKKTPRAVEEKPGVASTLLNHSTWARWNIIPVRMPPCIGPPASPSVERHSSIIMLARVGVKTEKRSGHVEQADWDLLGFTLRACRGTCIHDRPGRKRHSTL
ncbi:hypothetical protein PLICRDRAFT_37832 [Plicaturopsis crispa FD-325 SS-3]|nr:hypothetical protein PLICRDRAFT_37832 [Plicaturopsis crispa FD-325 SS-3]